MVADHISDLRPHERGGARPFDAAGFTMIELIMVMLVVGILAVVALPRFAERSVFESRGFADEVKALLRYGQKAAIAQRRTVCVEFIDAKSVRLRIHSTPNLATCDTDLAGPNGSSPFRVTAGSGTGHDRSAADNFVFFSSGQPSAGRSIAVTGAGTVTVEAVTGYVH